MVFKSRNEQIAQFYNQRVGNLHDLNTRVAKAADQKLPHYHTGIVHIENQIPSDEVETLIWFFQRQQDVCDLVWNVALGTGLYKPTRVLDLGCGAGGTLKRFRELTNQSNELELAGITLSSKQKELASRHLSQATILVGDMLKDTRLPAGWFNLIVAIGSTEYVSDEYMDSFMRRTSSLLSTGGVLIVVANSRISQIDTPQQHLINSLNKYYLTRIANFTTYLTAAKSAGLVPLGEIDLSPKALNYWSVRHTHETLFNSKDGWLEKCAYQIFNAGLIKYIVFIWARL